MRTPLLVDTSTTFEEYIKRLSRTDKKKYKKSKKSEYSFTKIEYDSKLMEKFINLWSRQLVYGVHPRWCYSMQQMDAMDTLVMFKIESDEIVAVHAIEKCNNFAYAHPPLYSKTTPELARFCWFHMIEWCCDNDVDYLDLDGGSHRTWPDLIKGRLNPGDDLFLNRIIYKWAYVPKDVKDNPDNEPALYQLRCSCGWKQLGIDGDKCGRCG